MLAAWVRERPPNAWPARQTPPAADLTGPSGPARAHVLVARTAVPFHFVLWALGNAFFLYDLARARAVNDSLAATPADTAEAAAAERADRRRYDREDDAVAVPMRWSYVVGQSEGKVKVDSEWL